MEIIEYLKIGENIKYTKSILVFLKYKVDSKKHLKTNILTWIIVVHWVPRHAETFLLGRTDFRFQ